MVAAFQTRQQAAQTWQPDGVCLRKRRLEWTTRDSKDRRIPELVLGNAALPLFAGAKR